MKLHLFYKAVRFLGCLRVNASNVVHTYKTKGRQGLLVNLSVAGLHSRYLFGIKIRFNEEMNSNAGNNAP